MAKYKQLQPKGAAMGGRPSPGHQGAAPLPQKQMGTRVSPGVYRAPGGALTNANGSPRPSSPARPNPWGQIKGLGRAGGAATPQPPPGSTQNPDQNSIDPGRIPPGQASQAFDPNNPPQQQRPDNFLGYNPQTEMYNNGLVAGYNGQRDPMAQAIGGATGALMGDQSGYGSTMPDRPNYGGAISNADSGVRSPSTTNSPYGGLSQKPGDAPMQTTQGYNPQKAGINANMYAQQGQPLNQGAPVSSAPAIPRKTTFARGQY